MPPTIRTRKFCSAAAALSALAMLTAPNGYADPLAPGQGCTFPTDGFTVNRADGALVVVSSQAGGVGLGPTGIYDNAGDRIVGNIERGAINGSKVNFTVVYEGGNSVRPPEVYNGDIFEDGSVSGDAFDYIHTKVHWTSPRAAITCTN